MNEAGFRRLIRVGVFLLGSLVGLQIIAGGSGLNTVVVINQNSSNSIELANYFCEGRQVPPENVLRIAWPGGNISWSSNDFQTTLLTPLLDMLAARSLTNQVDYVVLSMDIPFETVNGSDVNGTTSALFYGVKTTVGPELKTVTNSYAASEGIFRQTGPASARGYSFLATMLTSDSLALAKQLVNQGVNSDATFPAGRVILAKTSDPLRNLRFQQFDNALYNASIRGNYSLLRVNSDSPLGQSGLLGYQTGLAGFNISPGTFIPGAIADSMTSFAGIIFGPNGQTTLLAFINAGAAGSYGTVSEPAPDVQKFPDPQVYFYQARGFSLAECYYQSLSVPYQGLIVAEPLAAPFASPASGRWPGVSSNSTWSGSATWPLQFSALNADHPLQQVDLFVDGKFFKTLTNLAPLPGNVLTLQLNGSALSYPVPANATVASIAGDLAALINAPANTNATGITARAFGDRLELRSAVTNRPVPPGNVRAPAAPGSTTLAAPAAVSAASSKGSAGSLTTFLTVARDRFLPPPVCGIKGCTIYGSISLGTWFQINITKATGARVSLSVTNRSATATVSDLGGLLVSLINSTPSLQNLDGVVAEDFSSGWSGVASFNLRARGQGSGCFWTTVRLSGSSSNLAFIPAVDTPLIDNLPDLQPRDHLYVSAGATNLSITVSLDTTALSDGFHELTAVAYEGNHVRTQTRTTVPVRVQNFSLSAALNLLDLPDTAPASGTYHLQIAANTNNISLITLFSTGGALSSATNLGTVTFAVDGTALGAGLHPFYGVVQRTDGAQYRTPIHWVRLTN